MMFWVQRGFTIMDTMMCCVTLIYKVYLLKDLMFTVDRSSTLTLAFSKMVTAVVPIFMATLVSTVMSTVLVFLISVGNTLDLAVVVGLTRFYFAYSITSCIGGTKVRTGRKAWRCTSTSAHDCGGGSI